MRVLRAAVATRLQRPLAGRRSETLVELRFAGLLVGLPCLTLMLQPFPIACELLLVSGQFLLPGFPLRFANLLFGLASALLFGPGRLEHFQLVALPLQLGELRFAGWLLRLPRLTLAFQTIPVDRELLLPSSQFLLSGFPLRFASLLFGLASALLFGPGRLEHFQLVALPL